MDTRLIILILAMTPLVVGGLVSLRNTLFTNSKKGKENLEALNEYIKFTVKADETVVLSDISSYRCVKRTYFAQELANRLPQSA